MLRNMDGGGGGHSGSRVFHGEWSPEESCLHINMLEMKAVYMTLISLNPQEGSCIMVNTDNTTVMAYINHQGGLVSKSLCLETEIASAGREQGMDTIGQAHTRTSECLGRLPLEKASDTTHRVDSEPSGSGAAVQHMGEASSRPLHN